MRLREAVSADGRHMLSKKGRSKKKARHRARQAEIEGFERMSDSAKKLLLESMRKLPVVAQAARFRRDGVASTVEG